MLVTGCGGPGTSDRPDGGSASEDSPVVTEPGAGLTVVADEDPVAQAVSTSRALFESAPVTVLVRADDRGGLLLGASAAVGLGVPLLLEPAGGGTEGLAEELDRLGADLVLAVGEAEGPDGDGADDPEVRVVPAEAGAVAEVTGLELGAAPPVAEDGDLAAVAGLDPEAPVALRVDDAHDGAGTDVDQLPGLPRPDRLDGTLVLAGDGASPAAVATARAAGARVQVMVGSADPRASADVVRALAADGVETVVALGPALAAEPGLDWKLETAATGAELPGGGQLLFPEHFLVALYGHPGTAALGLLGEQPVEAAIDRAREHAGWYDPLVGGRTVVPAFEIIATVASSSAGADGDYSTEADVERLRPWVEAASEAGVYVVLDLQPGRTDFVAQAERYRPLLELPHVGLALDPEWRLGPGEVHLAQIGSVGIDEVNRVVAWLADLTRERRLPQKLLVLHQFRLSMLPGREQLDTSREELAVMVHADGQGSQAAKQETWGALHRDAPPVWWGWKNFYDEDAPMLTPEQTVEQVRPLPDLISYQ